MLETNKTKRNLHRWYVLDDSGKRIAQSITSYATKEQAREVAKQVQAQLNKVFPTPKPETTGGRIKGLFRKKR